MTEINLSESFPTRQRRERRKLTVVNVGLGSDIKNSERAYVAVFGIDAYGDLTLAATSNPIGIAGFSGVAISLVLVRSDPRDVVGAIELSRATYRKMIQNLVWASAYNLLAIPIAGGLLVRWGFDLPMSVGAIAMSVSTIIVAANAQLLRRVNLQRVTLLLATQALTITRAND